MFLHPDIFEWPGRTPGSQAALLSLAKCQKSLFLQHKGIPPVEVAPTTETLTETRAES